MVDMSVSETGDRSDRQTWRRRNACLLAALSAPALFVIAGAAAACELTTAPPVSQFDATLYVFIGEVREVVGPVNSEQVVGNAWGIRVEPTQLIAAPAEIAETVDVFEFELSPGCEAIGLSAQQVSERFPPGSQLRVVARLSDRLGPAAAASGPRLEAGPFHAPSVLAVRHPDEPPLATLDPSEYEWRSYAGRVTFELVSGLSRLASAQNDAERAAILRRIGTGPLTHPAEIDFAALVQRYIAEPAVADTLLSEFR